MGVFDIIIIALFLILTIIGFTKGFTKQVLSSFAWLIALIASSLLCKYFAELMMNSSFGFSLTDKLSNWISSKGEIFSINFDSLTEETMIEALKELDIPSIFHPFLIDHFDYSQIQNTTLSEFIAPKLTYYILLAIAYIFIYFVVFLMVKLLSKILGDVMRKGALGFIDGILGAIWGFAKATIIVSIIMLVVSLIMTLPIGDEVSSWLINDIGLNKDTFTISKFVYENNPIVFIISKFLGNNI